MHCSMPFHRFLKSAFCLDDHLSVPPFPQLGESLSRLGTTYIDLYYQHRADVNTPIEAVMATLKELKARPGG